jgi:hypothetical protein
LILALAQTTSMTTWLGVAMRDEKGGPVVIKVYEGGAAEAAGVQVGDVIVEFDGKKMKKGEDVSRASVRVKRNVPLPITVMRDRQRMDLAVVLSPDRAANVFSRNQISSRPAPPSSGSAPATVGRGREERVNAVQGAVSDRMSTRLRGAQGGSSTMQGGTLELLRDEQSRNLLAAATAKTQYAAPAAASKRLLEFNVLKYAFVDADGSVNLVGTYDPAYATGPINYAALLRDAVENPYPKLSLDPPNRDPLDLGGLRVVDADIQRGVRDPNYASELGQKLLVQPLFKSNTESPDRRYFIQRLKQKFNISEEEFNSYRNWVATNFLPDLNEFVNTADFTDKLLVAGGAASGCGRIYVAMKDLGESGPRLSQQEVRRRLEQLAIYASLTDALARADRESGVNKQAASRALTGGVYQKLLGCLGAPEREAQYAVSNYMSGRATEDAPIQVLNAAYLKVMERSLLSGVFASFPLSQATLGSIYNVPPIMSPVNTFGGRRNSAVLRAFFDADYTLKYLTTSNLTNIDIPGHVSSQEFLAQQERAGGRAPNMGSLRFWIQPGEVRLDVLENGAGVRFSDAKVKIGGEVMAVRGADGNGEKALARGLVSYADSLTSRYEQYARAYPSLHAMRETAKVIALARWAKSKGVRLKLTAEGDTKPVPERAEGFWGMTFMFRAGSASDLLFLWAQGGVDYSQQAGDGWVSAQPNQKATSDVLEQLAASTALAQKAAAADSLESARDLAQRSADAMTGHIDLTGIPGVPPPSPLGPGETLASRAAAAQTAIAAADANAAVAQAKADLQQAEALKTSDPAKYAQAQAAVDQSEKNLQHLNEMMRKYNLQPVTTAVDLRGANLNKPVVVQPLSTGVAGRAPGCPITPKKALPTRAELVKELAEVHKEVDMLGTSLQRLNRTIQMDQKQFAEWEKEVEAAQERAKERLKKAIQDKIKDTIIDYEKDYYTKIEPSPEKLKVVETIDQLLKQKDVYDWANKGKTDWEQFGEGIRTLADNLPFSKEAQSLLWACENIIDSSYDIVSELASWNRISQLRKNSDVYLTVVNQSGERMKRLIARMKEIETQLASGNYAPAVKPEPAPGSACM